MTFGKETIGKHTIEIDVDRKGVFSAEFGEVEYKAQSVADLVEQLKKAVKRLEKVKPIAVTVLGLVAKTKRNTWDTEHFIEGDGAVDAVLRGYHDRNRVWLLTSVDGKQKFQVGGYNSEGIIVRRLTLEETLRWQALTEARRVAATAIEDFVGEAKVDPDELLEAARQAADK